MTRVYLDNCVINRPFDDQSQELIRLETEAIILLLSRLGSQALELKLIECRMLISNHVCDE